MCLAVPGKVLTVDRESNPLAPMGMIDLQGTRLEANLIMTPDVGEGDWVLVHAGFAIQHLDEEEARETWEYLKEAFEDPMSEVGEGS